MPHDFGPNIVIDGRSFHDAPRISKYETSVHRELICVLAFDTGRAVINEVWSIPRRLQIRPWSNRRQLNADAGPTNDRAATAPFQPVRDGTDGHHEAAWGHGTGRGSDVRIRYSPWSWGDDAFGWDPIARNNLAAFTGTLPPLPGEDAAEVLLHELVHSLRQMSGRGTRLPMGRGFDTQEEFFAILVTNIYTSERGRHRQLRADHGTTPLLNPRDWRTDREFQALIRAVSTSQPSLVNRLARVRAPFNPFAGNYGPRSG